MVSCDCSCKYNKDGWCDKDYITISDAEMTAAGFYPICQDYEEREDFENRLKEEGTREEDYAKHQRS